MKLLEVNRVRCLPCMRTQVVVAGYGNSTATIAHGDVVVCRSVIQLIDAVLLPTTVAQLAKGFLLPPKPAHSPGVSAAAATASPPGGGGGGWRMPLTLPSARLLWGQSAQAQ